MQISQEDLLKIVQQASNLAERLSEQFIPDESQTDEKQITSRLETWCHAVGKGNPEQLTKRLNWDNLDPHTVVKLLGDVRLANPEELPAWTETLKQALQTEVEPGDTSVYRCLNPEKAIPFEEIYLPFVQVARQKLIQRVDSVWQLLSATVHIS